MPAGRPKREYTEGQMAKITELARNGCHTLTIANIVGIPEATLRDNFREVLTKERAEHKNDIRVNQIKAMKAGNPAMGIFLGKNYLGQTDKQTQEHIIDKETATLLGLIDGKTKGQLPTEQEVEEAGE